MAGLPDPLTLLLPTDLLEGIEAVAETCGRTRSWVMVRALRLYLAGEGADVLAVRRGREQIAAGEFEDIDDVIAEIEAIVSGKPDRG